MNKAQGMVWFIGAGPGDPELITVKGKRLIGEADLVLYAGSLVPAEVVACAKAEAKVVDSASLHLEEIIALLAECAGNGGLAARVHTGDSGLYGSMREQKALLEAAGIPCGVVPGVTASFAAAAAAGLSLTTPEKVQSFAVTRLHGRTPVPEGQRVRDYARCRGTLAVYLSAGDPAGLVEELRAGGLPEDVPILMAYRAGWPDQRLARTTLSRLEEDAKPFSRQTVFLILPGEMDEAVPSKLYDKDFVHGYRG